MEVGELLATLSARRDAAGCAAVVRNGYQPERAIAERNWRKLRGFKYLAKVFEGVTFVDREEIEQPKQVAA